ncbi:MAG TPA: alcohol dehydrogenase catalytic domain-containing protein [Gemmatimonadaceae bacterium]|nr:alcohol dehydrogenase catalytic domain-containing protein [Gemmatimonadaceae bacterium]
MRALVLKRGGTLSLEHRPKPAAREECLIRVAAAGICGTDLELLRGYAGFTGVPGHEFVGIVEGTGPNDSKWIGRRVVGEITVGCGRCAGCRAAGRGHCDVRTVIGIRDRDGAFAEYLSLPTCNLHAVPDSIDDITAVFVEPGAAACRVVEQVAIAPGQRAAVVGAGRLGLLVAQVLRVHGAEVTVVVRSETSRATAKAMDFETMTVDGAKRLLARRVDVAVDATGQPDGFKAAASLVRPRGTLVVKSTIHGETPILFSDLVVDEITVVGSRCGPFARAIDLLANGQIDVKPFATAVFPLGRYEDAFEYARHGAAKAILSPSLVEDVDELGRPKG